MLTLKVPPSTPSIQSGSWYAVTPEDEGRVGVGVYSATELDCANFALKASANLYCYHNNVCNFPAADTDFSIENAHDKTHVKCRKLGSY